MKSIGCGTRKTCWPENIHIVPLVVIFQWENVKMVIISPLPLLITDILMHTLYYSSKWLVWIYQILDFCWYQQHSARVLRGWSIISQTQVTLLVVQRKYAVVRSVRPENLAINYPRRMQGKPSWLHGINANAWWLLSLLQLVSPDGIELGPRDTCDVNPCSGLPSCYLSPALNVCASLGSRQPFGVFLSR